MIYTSNMYYQAYVIMYVTSCSSLSFKSNPFEIPLLHLFAFDSTLA